MENFRAFPFEVNGKQYTGMTLRDWFAGQFISSVAAGDAIFYASGGTPPANSDEEPTHIAEYAYKIADAMMEERKK